MLDVFCGDEFTPTFNFLKNGRPELSHLTRSKIQDQGAICARAKALLSMKLKFYRFGVGVGMNDEVILEVILFRFVDQVYTSVKILVSDSTVVGDSCAPSAGITSKEVAATAPLNRKTGHIRVGIRLQPMNAKG